MTTIDEHKKIVQEFVEDINEKIKAGLLTERQKIIGFSTSEAATNLFAIFLHSKSLIEPSFNLNHRFFASKRIAEKKFDFEIPNKQQLLDLLIKQESYRNQLCYGRDFSTRKLIELGTPAGIVAAQSIGEPGTQLTMRTFHIGGVAGSDITHGLPRIEEVFEARSPKGKAYLAESDGTVEDIEERGVLKVIKLKAINSKKKKAEVVEYPVSKNTDIYVKVGDMVKAGTQLCEGNLDLKELFSLKGNEAAQRYITNEIQRIYLSEGASINNKHIEVIIRQMFSRVKIKEAGDTNFVAGDVVEKSKFLEENRKIKRKGGAPAKAKQLLLGITKVALTTESFLSAASFQETARVLINAATQAKVDILRGLKENVIIGRLVPVGTGFAKQNEESRETTETEVDEGSVS